LKKQFLPKNSKKLTRSPKSKDNGKSKRHQFGLKLILRYSPNDRHED